MSSDDKSKKEPVVGEVMVQGLSAFLLLLSDEEAAETAQAR